MKIKLKDALQTVDEMLRKRKDKMLITDCLAISSLVKALKQDAWIKYDQNDLPPENCPYLVTIESEDQFSQPRVERCAHRAGIWYFCNEVGEVVGYLLKTENVSAYKSIPEAFKEEV